MNNLSQSSEIGPFILIVLVCGARAGGKYLHRNKYCGVGISWEVQFEWLDYWCNIHLLLHNFSVVRVLWKSSWTFSAKLSDPWHKLGFIFLSNWPILFQMLFLCYIWVVHIKWWQERNSLASAHRYLGVQVQVWVHTAFLCVHNFGYWVILNVT